MNTTIYLTVIMVMLAILICDSLRYRRYQKNINNYCRVLVSFRQLRDDLVTFMHDGLMAEPRTLSHEEYVCARHLLDVLNATIRNYNHHKTQMFNMRKMAKHLKTYRHTANTTVDMPSHPCLRKFHAKFGRLLVYAFLAYTPLIRSELALRLLALIYRAGYHAGKKTATRRQAKRDAKYVINHAAKVRDDARRYGLIASESTV